MRTAQPNSSQTPIARDFQNVVDDAHELLKTVQSEGEVKINEARTRVQDSIDTARVKLSDSLDSARVKLGEVGTQVTDSAKQAAATTDEYVRAHPWHAVGVGALAGALVGFLIARR